MENDFRAQTFLYYTLVSFVMLTYTLFLQKQLNYCTCSIKKIILKFVGRRLRTGQAGTKMIQ